jgi:SAM-dependent methyltransferase
MKLARILPFAHTLLKMAISKGDIVIDATVGNGNDTLFLTELVGATGHVFGFDIQEQALQHTYKRLEEEQKEKNVTLYLKSHDQIKSVVPFDSYGKITAAIFNLGYLPGGDKQIVTKPQSTIVAIKQLLEIMAIEGIIVLVVYHGHPEGQLERDELVRFVENFDQQKAHVLEYRFMNQQNNPPFIIAIEKRV